MEVVTSGKRFENHLPWESSARKSCGNRNNAKPMIEDQIVRKSKFLSLVLRHNPGKIGLTLDENGWARIDELIQCAGRNRVSLSVESIREIVESNDKKRFAISEDGSRIRANQGHSVQIDLALKPQEPPDFLYHGTATRFLDSILSTGLNSGNRQHVHLSADFETAVKVGSRHGKPVVLRVSSGDMHRAGIQFFLSENGVWLSNVVLNQYLSLEETLSFPNGG